MVIIKHTPGKDLAIGWHRIEKTREKTRRFNVRIGRSYGQSRATRSVRVKIIRPSWIRAVEIRTRRRRR
jgi:hypothetical protein